MKHQRKQPWEKWSGPFSAFGVLLEGCRAPQTSAEVFRKAGEGQGALFFPLGGERGRSYFIYHNTGNGGV